MSKGFWPAVSGSIAQSQRLDTVANNLANSDTNGFKRDQVSFKTIMSDAQAAAQKEDVPRRPYTEKDLYRLDGREQAFVAVDGTHADFAQGRLKTTNNPLDLAIEGKGFFEVLTPQGPRFTRQGNFKITAEGGLVTNDGFPVLARGGGPVADPENPSAAPRPETREEASSRAIILDATRGLGQVSISASGTIYQGREPAAELSLVEFGDPRLLVREGSATYRSDIAANRLPQTGMTTVRQGMLEASNVNAVAEMTELLKATRLFEANQKVVRSYGDLEQRAVNDIGRF